MENGVCMFRKKGAYDGCLTDRMGIVMPPAAVAVTLDSRIMKKEMESVWGVDSAGALTKARNLLQATINDGYQTFRRIIACTALVPASLEDIRNLVYFIAARAIQKSASFTFGTVTLYDPEKKIAGFLDSCPRSCRHQLSPIRVGSVPARDGMKMISLTDLPFGADTLLYTGESGRTRLAVHSRGPSRLNVFMRLMKNRSGRAAGRMDNELILDMDELNGTGNIKERIRDGQARDLVLYLCSLNGAGGSGYKHVKRLMTATAAIFSTLDNEGETDRAFKKYQSLDKAVAGLSEKQKNRLKQELTSTGIQDLANELLTHLTGMLPDVPGYPLSSRQERHMIQLMADARETLNFLTIASGGMPRIDAVFTGSRAEGLIPTVSHLSGSLTPAKSQERLCAYISGISITERSALHLKRIIPGKGMIIGTGARKLFPSILPEIDQKRVNEMAGKMVSNLIDTPGAVNPEQLCGVFGIPDAFMNQFYRHPVWVDRICCGGPGKDVEEELIRFMGAAGGPEEAVTLSRLMSRPAYHIPEAVIFSDSRQSGQALQSARRLAANQSGGDIPHAETRCVTLSRNRGAVIDLKFSLGPADGIVYCTELVVCLNHLGRDVQIDDMTCVMTFTSND